MQSSNKIFILAAALMLTLGALAWQAGATSARPPAQPTAIATVDIVEIIDGLQERVVLEDQLNTRTQARQQQLTDIVNQVNILQEDMKDVGDRTSDDYKEQIRQLMELQAVAKARRDALTQIISIDLGTVRGEMYAKVVGAISRIAEREGYDMVMLDDSLFKVPQNSPDSDVFRAIVTKSIIYRHDSINITNDVITLMNNEFNAP